MRWLDGITDSMAMSLSKLRAQRHLGSSLRSPAVTISWNLLKLMSIESVMPSNHLILFYPLPLPPSIFLSSQTGLPWSSPPA